MHNQLLSRQKYMKASTSLQPIKLDKKNIVKIYDDYKDASLYVAQRMAGLIKAKESKEEKTILDLATGSSPKQVYQELVRLHKNEELSFKNVISFNLDEYYPMQPIEEQSYTSFMNKNLFDYIDILPQNIHIPDDRQYSFKYSSLLLAI